MMKKIKISGILLITFFILSALMSSCSQREEKEGSRILSASYNTESRLIEISSVLSSADIREFRGETIYLIEIPANSSAADIKTLIPVSQAKAGAEMTFSIPLIDGARTRLYSSFVLAAFDNANGYIALSDAAYIDNVDALAKNKSNYPSYSSIKGLSIASSSDALSLGVKHTVLRLPIEDYIIYEGTKGAQTYIFDGNSHYYDGAKIAELDYKVKNLSGSGIEIYFEITLDTHPSLLSSQMLPLASMQGTYEEENEAEGYAISASNGDSYRQLAAFFEFLAERYTREDGKYGFAAAYIIGRGVNSPSSAWKDDARTLSESVERYSKLLSIASTALRSKYANGKIFVSIDNKWNIEREEEKDEDELNPAAPIPLRTEFGGAEFLDALKKQTENAPGLYYGVALIPNCSENSSEIWRDKGAKESGESEFLTIKNLGEARSLIGEEKELIIYNFGISAENEISMAASYAYAFLKAVESNASAFIYNGQFDFATGNGKTGLFTSPQGENEPEKRKIYDVFQKIDVIDEPQPKYVETKIGKEWNLLWDKYGEDIRSLDMTSSWGSGEKRPDESSFSEQIIFNFSEGKSFDFFPSDSTSYIEIGEYLGDRVLKSGMLPKYKGENMGVRSAPIPFDIIGSAEKISTYISADSGEGNTATLTLALTQSGAEKSVFHASKVNIQSSNRQKVTFDISEARLRKELGDVTMYIWVESRIGRSPYYEGAEAQDLLLYIENISATIKQEGKGAVFIIIAVILALVVLFVFGFLFILSKRRLPERPMPPQRGNMRNREPQIRQGRPGLQGQRPPINRGVGSSGGGRPLYPPSQRPLAGNGGDLRRARENGERQRNIQPQRKVGHQNNAPYKNRRS